jgi:hypothetical protein
LGKDTPDYAREPLLQHYGIKTRWIDIVDNLWTCLMFTTLAYAKRKLDRIYTYVSRANVVQTHAPLSFNNEIKDSDLTANPNAYSYILLLLSDQSQEVKDKPGYYAGSEVLTIDLRKAAPSIFLRPHCQHAILMRAKNPHTLEEVDMSRRVNLIIRVERTDVIDWLGAGRLVRRAWIYSGRSNRYATSRTTT